VRSLTRDQFLKIFGLSSGAFDAQQRAGHVALAFGTPSPAMPGRYCDLDLTALAIAEALAPPLGRPSATTIVLGFFNQWVAAVGQADADPARDYFFAIGGFGWGNDRKHFRELLVTHGAGDQIMSDLGGARSVIAVNITQILERLRDKAVRLGLISRSRSFSLPSTRDIPRSSPSSNRSARRASLACAEPIRNRDTRKR
jgi:hypothetical protein